MENQPTRPGAILPGNLKGITLTTSQESCLVCLQSSQQVPLLALHYQGVQYYICPQHLPILIHHPEQLAGKLPGVEDMPSTPHAHDDAHDHDR